ncbi:MAG: right-handed parallel beta-helix repeat-containing protein [Planctomycetota bacterium]|jgi:hypothetical protein
MRITLLIFMGFIFSNILSAATYYVDQNVSVDGSGSKEKPFKSLAGGVKLLKAGDTLSIVPSKEPYREWLNITYINGTAEKPVIVEGNGAVLSGQLPMSVDKWEVKKDGIWFYDYPRVGANNPFLLSHGRRLVRRRDESKLQDSEFVWNRKGLFFKPGNRKISDYKLTGTLISSGVILYGSTYIVINNITAEYFSNDGFNIHQRCRGLYFNNITGRHNGDDGFSIHEQGEAFVRKGHFHNNTYGIQDIQNSRSTFNAVLIEKNMTGVHFAGGFHTLIDCEVRDNKTSSVLIDTRPIKKKSPRKFYADGLAVIDNTLIRGGKVGVTVQKNGRLRMTNTTILASDTGLLTADAAAVEVERCIIADTKQFDANIESTAYLGDYNIFTTGRIKFLETDYTAEKFADFQKACGNENNSKVEKYNTAELMPVVVKGQKKGFFIGRID